MGPVSTALVPRDGIQHRPQNAEGGLCVPGGAVTIGASFCPAPQVAVGRPGASGARQGYTIVISGWSNSTGWPSSMRMASTTPALSASI